MATDEQVTKVVTGRVGSVVVYEITEHELSQFEQGSSVGLDLNVGVALFSLGVAGIFTLATATSFVNPGIEKAVWSFATVGTVVGVIFLLKWALNASRLPNLAAAVRARAPLPTTVVVVDSNTYAAQVEAQLGEDPTGSR